MALVAYNVLSTVKGGSRCMVRRRSRSSPAFYLADEIQMCHRGMMKAIPKDEWVVFQAATTTEFAEVMKVWARSVPLEEYASNPRGPKKPKLKKQSGAKIKHVSTFRILKGAESMYNLTR